MAQCDARKQTIGGMILFDLPESVYNGHALVTQYLLVRRKKPVDAAWRWCRFHIFAMCLKNAAPWGIPGWPFTIDHCYLPPNRWAKRALEWRPRAKSVAGDQVQGSQRLRNLRGGSGGTTGKMLQCATVLVGTINAWVYTVCRRYRDGSFFSHLSLRPKTYSPLACRFDLGLHVFRYSLCMQCFAYHFLCPKCAAVRHTGSKVKKITVCGKIVLTRVATNIFQNFTTIFHNTKVMVKVIWRGRRNSWWGWWVKKCCCLSHTWATLGQGGNIVRKLPILSQAHNRPCFQAMTSC